MKIASHICSASPISWVEKMTVAVFFSSRIASRMTTAFTGSSPLNGSSRRTSAGFATIVAMNCTFWDMPFERLATFFCACGARPSRSSQRSMTGFDSPSRIPFSAA